MSYNIFFLLCWPNKLNHQELEKYKNYDESKIRSFRSTVNFNWKITQMGD